MQDLLVTWFGATGATVVRYAIALIVVIGLLMLLRWFLRNYAAGGQLSLGRARQNRLSVVDQVVIDQRRRLLLVRRDGVEHLILIGGGNDLVVEPTIIRGVPVGSIGRPSRPAQPPAAPSDDADGLPADDGEPAAPAVRPAAPAAVERIAERAAPRPAFPSHVATEHPKATSIQARLNRVPPRKPPEASRPEPASPYIPPEAHRVEPSVAPIAAIVPDRPEPAAELPRSERRLAEPARAVQPPAAIPPVDEPGFDDLARQLDEALKSEIEGFRPEAAPAPVPEPAPVPAAIEPPAAVEPAKPVVPAASAWLRPRPAVPAPRPTREPAPSTSRPVQAPTPRVAPAEPAVNEAAPAAPEPVVTPRVAEEPEASGKSGGDFSSLENEMARLLDELAGDSKGKR